MDLSVGQMMQFQRELQALHPEWGGLYPERAKDQLLWSIAEMGEAAQIIKKLGAEKVARDERLKADFAEEVGDVMMYLYDALLCLGVSAEDFSKLYYKKCMKNQKRDYEQEHTEKYGV